MKNTIKTLITFALLLCVLCVSVYASQIKNVIFLIPDGAGMNSFDMSNDVKEAGGFADGIYVNRTPVQKGEMFMKDSFAGLSTKPHLPGIDKQPSIFILLINLCISILNASSST